MSRLTLSYRMTVALLALLIAAMSLFAPPAAQAQNEQWLERATTNFTILYTAGEEAEAERYAGFVDTIYNELAAIFSHQVAPPITLRLFPTLESYYQVNPVARNFPGVVAHADFRKRELVVIIEQTRQQMQVEPSEIENNIRHELTHIIASDLSGNRLNTGFQEGIAQYVEQSAPALREHKARLVEQAFNNGTLLTWSDFDNRDKIYNDPQNGYPQVLSAVTFLVERYGFARLRSFLTVSAISSGYRSALERAYGVSPTVLEAEWRDWLPSYFGGGYQRNVLSAYNLDLQRQLIAQGRYSEAQQELEQAIAWLQQNAATQPAEVLAEAQLLLERSQQGARADRMTEAARVSLEQLEYDKASQLIAQARDIYAELGDSRQDAVLQTYAERVSRGLSANAELLLAHELAQSLRFPQARIAADKAAAQFALLGDQMRFDNALALRHSMDVRQRLVGIVMVAVGLFGVILSLLGRVGSREAEAW